jgi:hypothetical protein
MLSILKSSTQVGMETGPPGYNFFANPFIHKHGIGISFEIPGRSLVSFKIFNLEGREVAEIAKAEYPAGMHAAEFVSRALPAGFSFLRMEADGFQATQRIFLRPGTSP